MDMEVNVLHEGWLFKAPRPSVLNKFLALFRKPHPKGFVPNTSDDLILEYFNDASKHLKKGSVDINNCDEILLHLVSSEKPYAFGLNSCIHGHYFFGDDSKDEVDAWVDTLRSYCHFDEKMETSFDKEPEEAESELESDHEIERFLPKNQMLSVIDMAPDPPPRNFHGIDPNEMGQLAPGICSTYVNSSAYLDSGLTNRTNISKVVKMNHGTSLGVCVSQLRQVEKEAITNEEDDNGIYVVPGCNTDNFSTDPSILTSSGQCRSQETAKKLQDTLKEEEEEEDDDDDGIYKTALTGVQDEFYVVPVAYNPNRLSVFGEEAGESGIVEVAYDISKTNKSLSLKRRISPQQQLLASASRCSGKTNLTGIPSDSSAEKPPLPPRKDKPKY